MKTTHTTSVLRRAGALLILLALPIAATPVFAITGEEIAHNVENREVGATTHAMVQMILTDRNGTRSERVIEQYGAEAEGDLTRSVIIFHQPASVKDTRFLSVENADRDDDQWIYLPALQRVRRIAAGEGSGSFMGTDFSYDDLGSRDSDGYTHTILRRENVSFSSGGATVTRQAYVVDVTPNADSDSQYSRMVEWVDPESWTPIRIELYDRDGELTKVNTVTRLERVQGFWTIIGNTMETVRTGHRTELVMQRFVYNQEIPAGLFTTNFLQTGRP